MLPKQKDFSDAQSIAEWTALLNEFETIIDGNPPADKVNAKLKELQSKAGTSKVLTDKLMGFMVDAKTISGGKE